MASIDGNPLSSCTNRVHQQFLVSAEHLNAGFRGCSAAAHSSSHRRFVPRFLLVLDARAVPRRLTAGAFPPADPALLPARTLRPARHQSPTSLPPRAGVCHRSAEYASLPPTLQHPGRSKRSSTRPGAQNVTLHRGLAGPIRPPTTKVTSSLPRKSCRPGTRRDRTKPILSVSRETIGPPGNGTLTNQTRSRRFSH
jgi:hypothetical protein